MGEWRPILKMVIVVGLQENTTATPRERLPVPARKKQPADAAAPPAKATRKKAAPARGAARPAPARKPRKTAALPDGGGRTQSLVIVESPAKARTINKYLGPGFKVLASMGHVRDLPK